MLRWVIKSPYSIAEVACLVAILTLTFTENGLNISQHSWIVFLISKIVLISISVWCQWKITTSTGVGMLGALRTSEFTDIPANEVPNSLPGRVEIGFREASGRFGTETAHEISQIWKKNRRVFLIVTGLSALFWLGFVVVPRGVHNSSILDWALVLIVVEAILLRYQRAYFSDSVGKMLSAIQDALELKGIPDSRAMDSPKAYREWCHEVPTKPYPFSI
jgi:hypothetical protein